MTGGYGSGTLFSRESSLIVSRDCNDFNGEDKGMSGSWVIVVNSKGKSKIASSGDVCVIGVD